MLTVLTLNKVNHCEANKSIRGNENANFTCPFECYLNANKGAPYNIANRRFRKTIQVELS